MQFNITTLGVDIQVIYTLLSEEKSEKDTRPGTCSFTEKPQALNCRYLIVTHWQERNEWMDGWMNEWMMCLNEWMMCLNE